MPQGQQNFLPHIKVVCHSLVKGLCGHDSCWPIQRRFVSDNQAAQLRVVCQSSLLGVPLTILGRKHVEGTARKFYITTGHLIATGPLKIVAPSQKCQLMAMRTYWSLLMFSRSGPYAIPTRDQTYAITIQGLLHNNWITHYSVPERIHCDQVRDFEYNVVATICTAYGIAKSRLHYTTPKGMAWLNGSTGP